MENNLENKWKYIVYQTTNLINNKIYVGVHKTKDPNIFDGYLGCGVFKTRPCSYQYAKTAFQCAVKKYGPNNFVRHTLAIFDTENEAYELEEQIVSETFLSRSDVYNIALGGKWNASNGTYDSRIKVYQYDAEGNFLHEYESFADAGLKNNRDYTLISYAVRKKCKAVNCYWNTDKVEKLDLSQYNNGNNHRIKVSCYLINGEFYKTFDSQQSCAKQLNICSGQIRQSCILGNCVSNKYYFSYIEETNYSKARTEYLKIRSVCKYDGKTGDFIKEYSSQIEAELENPKSNITKSIRLKTPDAVGFSWGIEKLENYNKPIVKNKKRKVGKFSLDEKLVQVYDSATQAAKENGTSVWKVLSGMNNTHKQHYYRYLEVNDIV